MIFLLIPIGVFLLDFFIKRWIDREKKLDESQEICKGRLILTKYYNQGAALNFLSGRPKLMQILHSVVLFITTLFYFFVLRKKGNVGLRASIGMLLGGGASNFFDRCTKGHVVDYCRLNVKNDKVKSIIFNVSDVFIFVGAILSVLYGSKE